MARVIQVIEAEVNRGRGIDESDPIRGVTQYWSFDGELLAENDPLARDRPTPAIMRGAQELRALYAKQAPITSTDQRHSEIVEGSQ